MKKYILILSLLIAACSGDEDPKPVYQVDSDFQVQVDAFHAEALARGYGELSKENLIIREYDILSQPNSNVSYSYKKNGQNYIEVYKHETFNCREASVFRELAHFYLSKPYSGNTSDIMSQAFNPCTYVHPDGEFYAEREEYLDDVFGAN